MAGFKHFEEIEAWVTARELTRVIYRLSGQGKFGQDYALRDQIRRAAVSALSNIAEGFESRTPALFVEFLGRARGSAGEVRAQLYVALDQEYISRPTFDETANLATKCSRQIFRLMEHLKRPKPV